MTKRGLALYPVGEARARILRRLAAAPGEVAFERLLPDAPERTEGEALPVLQLRSAWSSTFVASLLEHLGPAQFANWLAASSLMTALTFIDFGIGSVLINEVSLRDQNGSNDSSLKEDISNALFALIVAGVLLATAITVVLFLTRSPADADSSRRAVGTTCLALCALSPLSLVARMRLGLGEVAIHSIWDFLNSFLTFAIILAETYTGFGLEAAVLSFCLVPIAILVANGVHLILRHPPLAPDFRLVSKARMLVLVKGGLPFFALNALSAVCFSFDSILAIQMLDPMHAAEYGVAQRLALGYQTVVTLSLLPFWPQFRMAVTRNDRRSAGHIIIAALSSATVLSAPIAFLILFAGAELVKLWTRGAIVLSTHLSVALAVWIPLFGLAAVSTSLMNIPTLLKPQLRLLSLNAIGSFIAKILLTHWFGGAGIFWGNIIGVTSCLLLPSIFVMATLWKRNGCQEVVQPSY